ncbi:hypothetical protein JMG10_01550 [Nostoc ellipsosporum NOK]|nr:hypothetical protein [Nostoc ellipsosporum NOK]
MSIAKILTVVTAAVALTVAPLCTKAQRNEEDASKGFKLEKLFTGGSVNASFFNGQTILGANPVLGYSLTDWADAGIAFNYTYSGARDYLTYDDKIRQTVWGPGVFARLYPVKFLFVQGQFEHNFSTVKYTAAPGSFYQSDKYKTEANSLLVGAGFASGREPGNNTFFYISVLFDVLKDRNSPYVNVAYNPNDPSAPPRVDIVPIIRAGVNVALFQGRYGRY